MDKMEKAFEKMDEIRGTCIDELPILYEIVNSVYNEFADYLTDKASSIKGFEEWQKKPLTIFSGNPIVVDNYVGFTELSVLALNILKGNGIYIQKTTKCASKIKFKWKLDLTMENYSDGDINSAVTSFRESVLNSSTIIDFFYSISETITKDFESLIAAFSSAQTPHEIEAAIEASKNIHGTIHMNNKEISKKVIADIEFLFGHYDFTCTLKFEKVENDGIDIQYKIEQF